MKNLSFLEYRRVFGLKMQVEKIKTGETIDGFLGRFGYTVDVRGIWKVCENPNQRMVTSTEFIKFDDFASVQLFLHKQYAIVVVTGKIVVLSDVYMEKDVAELVYSRIVNAWRHYVLFKS